MSKIAIYAEKPDVGYKIAVAFKGVYVTSKGNNILVDLDNYEEYKSLISKKYSSLGYIPIKNKTNEIKVTWGSGHLGGLKQAEDYDERFKNWSAITLPYFPEKYEIKIRPGYNAKTKKKTKVDPNAKKQLKVIKDVFDWSDYIINATDDDREGELIFAYVYELTRSKKHYKRVFLDSFTQEGIMTAFKNLKSQEDVRPIELAGRAKSIADWVVGANITVAATRKFAGSSVISVGRVQTPTVNLIVQRQKEIDNFVPKDTFSLEANFENEKGLYTGLLKGDWFEKEDEAKDLLEQLKGQKAVITKIEKKEKKEEPPLLYNLSAIQSEANNLHGLTAKDTLAICQELYSKGYTTYPRTSSAYLPDDNDVIVDEILDLLAKTKEFGDSVNLIEKSKRRYTKRHFNSKKTGSHFAIRPTNKIPNMDKLTTGEKNIYTLIANSVIRAVFPPILSESTKIETDIDKSKFITNGSVIKEASWMQVGNVKRKDVELPNVEEGDVLEASLKVIKKTSKPPSRFTDSSLVSAMIGAGKQIGDEALRAFITRSDSTGGIGTEATRAGIIETIISRGYVERQGKFIVPTQKGIDLIETLPIEELKSAEITAKWEERLSKIERKEDTLEDFVSDLEKQVKKWTEEVLNKMESKELKSDINVKCPNCNSDIIENDFGFFCSANEKDNPKSCQFKLFKNNKTKFKPSMSVKDLESLVNEGKTLIHKAKGKKGEYQFYYLLDEDNQSTQMAFPSREKR